MPNSGPISLLSCYGIPDVDVNETMDDFLSGYYGNASGMIKEYITIMHDKMEHSGTRLDIFGKPADARESFLSDSLITIYNQIFDRAEDAVSSDPDKLNHVRSARLPVQYAILEIARDENTGKLGAFVTDSSGLLKPDPGKVDILNKFLSQCKATGATRVTEWNTTPEEYFEKYTNFLDKNSGKPASEQKK